MQSRAAARATGIRLLLATALTLAVSDRGHTQTLDKGKLDQFFDRLAEKNKAMGSLTIAKDGKVLYTRAIGYSQINGADKKPLTAATRCRIGSITKMFTAAMIFQLVEEGKAKLTDTLDKFFPQIPNARSITLAHILAHRSGIHDSLVDRNLRPDTRTAPRTAPMTKDELLAVIAKGKPDFEPGTKLAYCNSAYVLLGLLVEKLTGKLYEEALAERIVAKIGLEDTYTATRNVDASKNESLCYRKVGGEWRFEPDSNPSILFGAGAIVSTPNDMARFIQALFDCKLVSQESLASMTTIKDGEGSGIGTFTFAGKTFYGHTGGGDNYGAWLAYLPEERLAVAYTTNAKVYPVVHIVSGVIDIYYGRPFQIPAFEPVAVSPDVLDKYVGVYSSPEAPVKFTITRDGTTLYVRPGEQSAAPLEALAPDRFEIEGAGVVFEFDAANKRMTVKQRRGDRVFTKDG